MPTNRRGSWRGRLACALVLLPTALAQAGEVPQEQEGQKAVAEAELALARARRDAAALGVKIAQAHLSATTSERAFREKQRTRIVELEKAGSADKRSVDEEQESVRAGLATERAAQLSVEIARLRLTAAEAAIREAAAIQEAAATGSGVVPAIQAEDDLDDARAEQADAQYRVEHARAEEARAEAFRLFRGKEFERLAILARRKAIEPRVVEEQEDRFRAAQADERQAEAKVDQARASVAIAEAAVRAAEARRDLARASARLTQERATSSPTAGPAGALKHLHEARVDRARAERDAARLEVQRAEAEAERDRATVASRENLLERVKQLAARRSTEARLVDEQELALTESRHILRQSEATVKSARARLQAIESRLKAIEAEVEPGG